MNHSNGNGHSRDFGDLELAVEHNAERERRAIQRTTTYSGRHEWRRNYHTADGRTDRHLRTSRPEPSSSGRGISLSPEYVILHSLFGSETQKVLAEYTPQQAIALQAILGKRRLNLPQLMDLGTVLYDGELNTAYLFSGQVTDALEEFGIPRSQFLAVKYGEALVHTGQEDLIVVTMAPEKRYPTRQMRPLEGKGLMASLRAEDMGNLLHGNYRDTPPLH